MPSSPVVLRDSPNSDSITDNCVIIIRLLFGKVEDINLHSGSNTLFGSIYALRSIEDNLEKKVILVTGRNEFKKKIDLYETA